MPPDQTNPIVPAPLGRNPTGEAQDGNNPPQKPGVDPKSFLLPKKEVHAPENATRVNAGALLEAEQSATLPKPETPPPPIVPPPPPTQNDTVVKPIETFQSDIERVVKKGNTSVVSIAAAEAERRGMSSIESQPAFNQERKLFIRKIVFIVGGVVFLLAAIGIVSVAFRPAPAVEIEEVTQAPFINVDETKVLTVPSGYIDHLALIAALEAQREAVSLSLGLISRFYIATAATSSTAKPQPLSTQALLTALSPTIPGPLIRSLDPDLYLLGVHSYDSNQPVLILKVDSYEQAFSNMLVWEKTMNKDLAPFFTRKPQVHLSEGVATSTATSTAATSTPVVIPNIFIDRVVENYDARVIQNENKDILLLWAFLNRSTLVITTNDATLREVISRLRNAPIVPLP